MDTLKLLVEPKDQWLLVLLAVQGVVVAFFCGVLLSIRVWRIFQDAHLAALEPLYLQWIVTALTQEKLSKVNYMNRHLMRNLILKMMVSLDGPERDRMVFVYKHLGFLDEDHTKLASRFADKLGAMARIETVRSLDSISYVSALVKDPDLFIRLAGIRFLLRQTHDDISVVKHNFISLESLNLNELVKMRRYDTLREFLDLLGKFHLESFLYVISEFPDSMIKTLALESVLANKVGEAMPAVRKSFYGMLETQGFQDVALCILHVECLSLVPEPENEAILGTVVKLGTGALRARGVKNLLLLRPDLAADVISVVALDSSPEVQRLVAEVRLESVA